MDVRIAGHGSLPDVDLPDVDLPGRTWRRRRIVPLADNRVLNIVDVLVVSQLRDDAPLLEGRKESGAIVLESALCWLDEFFLFQRYCDIGPATLVQICDLLEIRIYCDGGGVLVPVDGRGRCASNRAARLAYAPDFPLLLI